MRLKQAAFILTAFTVGVVFAAAILQAGTPPPALAWADTVFDPRLLSTEPPLPIPPLSAIIDGAATDADALAAVVDHYERNRVKLAAVFTATENQAGSALFGLAKQFVLIEPRFE